VLLEGQYIRAQARLHLMLLQLRPQQQQRGHQVRQGMHTSVQHSMAQHSVLPRRRGPGFSNHRLQLLQMSQQVWLRLRTVMS
jgi:hypothetical protein